MNLDFQNLVQVFLVAGGVAYVGWGVLTNDLLRVGLGVLAVAVGVAGLYRDRPRSVTDAD